jgi:hypothetical protein
MERKPRSYFVELRRLFPFGIKKEKEEKKGSDEKEAPESQNQHALDTVPDQARYELWEIGNNAM